MGYYPELLLKMLWGGTNILPPISEIVTGPSGQVLDILARVTSSHVTKTYQLLKKHHTKGEEREIDTPSIFIHTLELDH